MLGPLKGVVVKRRVAVVRAFRVVERRIVAYMQPHRAQQLMGQIFGQTAYLYVERIDRRLFPDASGFCIWGEHSELSSTLLVLIQF